MYIVWCQLFVTSIQTRDMQCIKAIASNCRQNSPGDPPARGGGNVPFCASFHIVMAGHKL